MKKISAFLICSFLCGASYAKHYQAEEAYDTKKAVEYFESELNFNTNIHGMEAAVEDKDPKIVILDVRTAKDYKEGHVPGAVSLPCDQYKYFEEDGIKIQGLEKSKIYYIYCYELSCNLSQKAAKQLALKGYRVKEVQGGFKAWKEKSLPIEK